MKAQENNKLIAEFMGFPKEADAVDDRTIAYYVGESILWTDNTDNENEDDVFHPDDMQFHKSWDWLMPVVEKIFSLGYDYEIKPRYMVIKERLSSEVLVSKCFVYDKSQKEIIYDAVVEFINEYNKNESTD